MDCSFYIKLDDKVMTLSADEIVGFLISNGFTADNPNINLENRIKYSLTESEEIKEKLRNDSKQHKEKITNIIDGDIEYEEANIITPLNLIDSDIFYQVGFPRIPQKDDENYLFNLTKLLISDEVPEEEALKMAKDIIDHHDVIANDAALLHRFLPLALANLRNETEFRKILLSEDFRPLYKKLQGTVTMADGKLKTKIELFIESLADVERTTMKYLRSGMDFDLSSCIINVSLDVDIPSINKTMSSHIDKIYIDLNGELYVINYKFSSTPYELWSTVKKEKYKYKMALIKRALEAKGYNIKGIKMYDIPMYIKYNGDDIISITRDPKLESINYIISENRAALIQYDNFVKQFIEVPVSLNKSVNQEDIDKIDSVLLTAFPQLGIQARGILMTAKLWIEKYNGICIVPNTNLNSDVYYFVDLQNGLPPIPIHDDTNPLNNKEILELVSKHTELFEKGNDVVMNHLIKSIRNNYNNKTCRFENGSGFKFNSTYLESVLKPYFEYKEIDGEKRNLWKMIETPVLHECGLILFRHKDTGLLDLVIASPYGVNNQMKLADGNTNLLGMHLYDMNAGHMLKGDYGNMEIIKGLAILNQVLPNLTGEFNLGNIKIITPKIGGSGRVRTFQQILPYFGKVLLFVNGKLETKVTNNFYRKQTTDPVLSILYEYNQLMTLDSLSDIEKEKVSGLGFLNLLNVLSTSERLQGLRTLAESILSKLNYPTIKQIQENTLSSDSELRLLSTIYLECIKTINYLHGNYEFSTENIDTFSRYVLPQYANPDSNVRMVTDIYSKALDETAIEFGNKYKPLRHIVEDFLEKSGYGSLQKTLLGNSVKLYDNLYELDINGNRTMRFKNPYEDPTLSSVERDFLKKVLFHINKLRADRGFYKDFFIKSENDSDIKKFILSHQFDYFLVPLKAKSSKTKHSKPIEEVQTKIGRFKRRLKSFRNDPQGFLELWVRDTQDKIEYSSKDKEPIEKLSVINPYTFSEDRAERATMLNRFGFDYFETDVELLLADYVEKHIVTLKMQEVEFRCKAILTELHMLGVIEGNEELFKASIKEIEDFLRVNMFGQSIMEDFSKKAMLVVAPLKSMVSKVYIAGNIRSAFRDSFEGVWQNIARVLNHYQTDIDSKSLLKGYELVIRKASQSTKGIGIMSELCLRYRLSNTDEARIAEKATNRGGFFDPDYWMYSTLRGPDFLNRMVLFTARCVKDGVWDAFNLDENGDLKYNWKKDSRFILFAQGNKSHPDYAKQKGLYLSRIRQYNLDHPNANLEYTDDLPEPYTQNEIKAIKQLSNSIYGAYDKSQRSKIENIALGLSFCMFSTWLNGITANYLRKPGEYSEYTELRQKIDEDGNKLYFNENHEIITKIGDKFYNDLNEEIIPKETNPVFEQIPVQVQGILYTFKRCFQMLPQKNGWNKIKQEVWTNEYEKANIMKAFSDLLWLMFFMALFGIVLTPAYNDFKKDKKKNDVLTNAVVELLYNSSANSYDGFKGMLAIKDYVLEDVEPLAVNANISLMHDLGKTMFGSMEWLALLYKDVPVFRAFKQTYNKLND